MRTRSPPKKAPSTIRARCSKSLPSWKSSGPERRSSQHRQRPGSELPVVCEFNRSAKMQKLFYLLLFSLTLCLSGCATQSWSYLYTQEPSPQQGQALIRSISDQLVQKFGFTNAAQLSHGNNVYERDYTFGRVSVSLKESKYPLVYVQVPRAQESSAEVQSLFRMIEQSYVATGLRVRGPAKETWF